MCRTGALLADIVRSLEPGAVTIEAEGEKVEIGAARSRFSLRTFPVDDFPSLPEPPAAGHVPPGRRPGQRLRQVVRAASSDDARPLLTGVLIAAEGDGIRLVATDSYRLAMRDIDGSDALADSSQILVPARALAELQKLSVLGCRRRTGDGDEADGDGQSATGLGSVRSANTTSPSPPATSR